MNLIDTYASEVGRRLPRKDRADIEAEICSALQDLLDERSREAGKPVDEEMTFEVLKEYGDPEKVASSYQGERYLIGPHLYPVFLMVIRIVFPAVAILAGIGAIVQVSQHVASVENISGVFVSVLVGVLTTTISALGNIVLIFAIIEWVTHYEGITVKGKMRLAKKEWDPRSLTRMSSPNHVKLGEMITEIVASFAAIVIFNFYYQVISFGFTSGEQWYVGIGSWSFTPLLSEAFYHYTPYLTAVWVLTIILDIILLRKGYWNKITRIISAGIKIIGLLLVVCLLVGPSLIGVTANSLVAAGISAPGDAGALVNLLNQVVRLALGLTIFLSGLDIIKTIIRIFRPSAAGVVNGK
ncbi:MAG TPA: hypothetical protein VII93_10200 [Anaerolineales bacterium]